MGQKNCFLQTSSTKAHRTNEGDDDDDDDDEEEEEDDDDDDDDDDEDDDDDDDDDDDAGFFVRLPFQYCNYGSVHSTTFVLGPKKCVVPASLKPINSKSSIRFSQKKINRVPSRGHIVAECRAWNPNISPCPTRWLSTTTNTQSERCTQVMR